MCEPTCIIHGDTYSHTQTPNSQIAATSEWTLCGHVGFASNPWLGDLVTAYAVTWRLCRWVAEGVTFVSQQNVTGYLDGRVRKGFELFFSALKFENLKTKLK